MRIKFHKKDGTTNWTMLAWTWYFSVILPMMIANIFINGGISQTILSTVHLFSLAVFLGILIVDWVSFKRMMKRDRVQWEYDKKWFDEKLEELKSTPPGRDSMKLRAEIMDRLNSRSDLEL